VSAERRDVFLQSGERNIGAVACRDENNAENQNASARPRHSGAMEKRSSAGLILVPRRPA